MAHFTSDFISFFKELRKNNDRDWFHANKKTFEKHVKKPFQEFIGEMIGRLHKLDERILITPKDAIFRIYRDTRFSKDKTPYKEHVSAIISKGGRKDMSSPGLYIQMNDEEITIYSGVYQPDKSQLEAIRYAIASDPKSFKTLYSAKAFVDLYDEIRGEKNKRLPKEFIDTADDEPLIYNKGFYYYDILPASEILSDDLPKVLEQHFKVARPLNDFFENAMK